MAAKAISSSRFLSQATARAVDEFLFQGYAVEQLMELAGLSVAAAVNDEHGVVEAGLQPLTALVVCGPGNNGGDGLVAARHLKQWGWKPTVVYPKPGRSELFQRLVKQLEWNEIEVVKEIKVGEKPHVVIDCVFGFSFDPKGGIRAPFDTVLRDMRKLGRPIVACDIPSGWHVETGRPAGEGALYIEPSTLVSLTAPKMCARYLNGQGPEAGRQLGEQGGGKDKPGKRHYLGGRFVHPALAEKFGFDLGSTAYPQLDPTQVVRIDVDAVAGAAL